jgi:hypothetical protein
MHSRPAFVSADALGISVSGVCIVHCGLAPLLFALAPGLAHYLGGSEVVHRFLAALVLAAGALALARGYRVHRKLMVMAGFLAGAALVMIGAIAGELSDSHLMEAYITFAGSASMAASHWKNRAFCRACGRCDHSAGSMIRLSQESPQPFRKGA